MLEQLTLENFGLVETLTMDFGPGLNVLTGATGAGKSIIIGALRFCLGDRIHGSQVRDAAQSCRVEAVFRKDSSPLWTHTLIQDFFSSDDEVLIITRSWTHDSRNKIRVNGKAITLTQLKALGNLLIDFHGPHDHQLLLKEDTHLSILDRLTNFDSLKEDFAELYSAYEQRLQQWQELRAREHSRQRDLDMLAYQIQELSQVPLNEEAYEDFTAQVTRLDNAQRLLEQAAGLKHILTQSEIGVLDRLSAAFPYAKGLAHMDPQATEFREQLEALQETAQQLARTLADYTEALASDPQEAEQARRQRDIYEDIKRKYGPSLANAQQYLDDARRKHDLLLNFESHTLDLEREASDLKEQCGNLAELISQARQATSKRLKKIIEKELQELGIAHVTFAAKFIREDIHAHGWDRVSFFISPNLGEDCKPLAEIISSGESARVMLALKKALTEVDPVPVLIFDEIDAQIGGRLGTITGRKLKELSRSRQVILVTHLPQIAAFANRHFKVEKVIQKKRTLTTVQELDPEQRSEELAHMLSGDPRHHLSLSHASSMLQDAQET